MDNLKTADWVKDAMTSKTIRTTGVGSFQSGSCYCIGRAGNPIYKELPQVSVRENHALMINDFQNSKMNRIDLYVKQGRMVDAHHVFDNLPKCNVVSWNMMILGYAKQGEGALALELYAKMQKEGVRLSRRTFIAALKACSSLAALEVGKQVDGETMKIGCLEEGRAIHSQAVTSCFESHVFVGTTLVDMYIKCGSIEDAHFVFDKLPYRDVVSWTAMILGYGKKEGIVALKLYVQMLKEGVQPNDRTFVAVLKACSRLTTLEEGKQVEGNFMKVGCLEKCRAIHFQVVKNGIESDLFVGTILVDVYAKCGSMEDAQHVFDQMPHRNVVSWTAMILGYAQKGEGLLGLQMYTLMYEEGVIPNHRTFVGALKACCSLLALEEGKQANGNIVKIGCLEKGRAIHSGALTSGFESHAFVGTTLVDTYVKCGSIEDARHVFDELPHHDVVSWTAMISGYAQKDSLLALELYAQMQQEGTIPDHRTYVAILKACSSLATLDAGTEIDRNIVKTWPLERVREVHSQAVKRCSEMHVFVANTLVDTYAKCRSLEDAKHVFDELPDRDVVSWTAIILGYAEKEEGMLALELYAVMHQKGAQPNDRTFVAALKSCNSLAALQEWDKVDGNYMKAGCLDKGRAIHSHIVNCGCESDVFVGTILLDMYAKCGSMEDAQYVFDAMVHRDVVSWNAMILGYAQKEDSVMALELFADMCQEGVIANHRTFVNALMACNGLAVLKDGKQVVDKNVTLVCLEKKRAIHCHVVKCGLESDVYVGNALLDTYAKCGSMEDAQNVFDELCHHDVFSWNAMISGYVQKEEIGLALELYAQMLQQGVQPSGQTFIAALKACSSLAALEEQADVKGIKGCLETVRSIQYQAVKTGFELDAFVGAMLVDAYVKCGSIEDAQHVFDNLPNRDVVSWTAMIFGYGQQEEGAVALDLYAQMLQESVQPNDRTYVAILKACSSLAALEEGRQVDKNFMKVEVLEIGRAVHSEVIKSGFELNVFVATVLVDMFAKCGSMEDAQHVFGKMPHRNVVSWTAMISGYVQKREVGRALELYAWMHEEGVVPNHRTFVGALKACSTVAVLEEQNIVDGKVVRERYLEKGRTIHSQVVKSGFDSHVFVGNTLLDMYAKFGSLEDAWHVFNELPHDDVVSWTAMISGFAQKEDGAFALELYTKMHQEGVIPDHRTFVSALKSCSSLASLDEGKQVDGRIIKVECLEKGKGIHSHVVKLGCELDVFVGNTLVDMYVKCGSMDDARHVFDEMQYRDTVSWSSMISGYTEEGKFEEALKLHGQMQGQGVSGNIVTFISILKACGNTGALETGKQIHADICMAGLDISAIVATTLIDMYSKCGTMVDAQKLFDILSTRDIVSWNALIAGYARQGQSETVFHLFDRMRQEGPQPNGITILFVLTLCSHVGLLAKGQKYLQAMCNMYGIEPTVEHYNCMIDLLGRAGQVEAALAMVEKMPFQPNVVSWMAVLGACQKWNNVDTGKYALRNVMTLDEKNDAAYVLMSNMHVYAPMWEDLSCDLSR